MLCSLQTLEEYCGKYKEEGEEFKTLINGVLPEGWADELPTFTEKDKGIATRLHSQTMLNALAPVLPGFWGGSAGMSLCCNSATLSLHCPVDAGQAFWLLICYGSVLLQPVELLSHPVRGSLLGHCLAFMSVGMLA